MAAYLIARLQITDLAVYDQYRQRVPGVVAQYGGRFLVRGGKNEMLEGDSRNLERVVVVEFPSYEQAQVFYRSAQYQEILPLRLAGARAEVLIVEGM